MYKTIFSLLLISLGSSLCAFAEQNITNAPVAHQKYVAFMFDGEGAKQITEVVNKQIHDDAVKGDAQ